MRIIGWNIRAGGGKRIVALAQQLALWEPDVVALCEFRGTSASQQLAATLAAAGLSHQLMTISTELPAANALLLAARYPLRQLTLPLIPPYPLRWLPAEVRCSHPYVIGALHVPNYVSKPKLLP